MTTKQNFEVEQPEVVVLKNGKYAFRSPCPWEGKQGKRLYAYKFCKASDYADFLKSKELSENEGEGA